MVTNERRYISEAGGIRLQLAFVNALSPIHWSVEDDHSHLIVNLGSTLNQFDAASHSRLYIGAPTVGEFSWVPPAACFSGCYGPGEIVFLKISPPARWPAPSWPQLAAFDLIVLRAARRLAKLVLSAQPRQMPTIVAELWHHLAARQEPCRTRRGSLLANHRFEDAQRLVSGDPSAVRSASDLAERTGASLDGLNKTFQQAFGFSAATFLDQARLRTARRLLSRTRLPLSQVAVSAGFSSHAHMTDRMRARLGVTPARLRDLVVRPPIRTAEEAGSQRRA